jgi:hypothetical protein
VFFFPGVECESIEGFLSLGLGFGAVVIIGVDGIRTVCGCGRWVFDDWAATVRFKMPVYERSSGLAEITCTTSVRLNPQHRNATALFGSGTSIEKLCNSILATSFYCAVLISEIQICGASSYFGLVQLEFASR